MEGVSHMTAAVLNTVLHVTSYTHKVLLTCTCHPGELEEISRITLIILMTRSSSLTLFQINVSMKQERCCVIISSQHVEIQQCLNLLHLFVKMFVSTFATCALYYSNNSDYTFYGMHHS